MTLKTESYDEQVGRAVRLVRKARGMTQTALAEAIGVAQSGVVLLEQGRTAWRAEQLARAAAALGVALGDLQPVLHMDSVSTAV